MTSRAFIHGIAALLAVLMAFAPAVVRAASIERLQAAFLHDGKSVRVEIIRPAGDKPVPAALVLHGASGIGRGWYVYPFAEALARRGVAAAVVHYYDGLGKRRGKASPRIFHTRDRILQKAVDYVMSRKDVAPGGVGIYGMSLGGFHALSLGVLDDRVNAVVSLGGALSRHIPAKDVVRLPPTLLLHGSRDSVVSVNRALETSRAMERFGAHGSIKIYKREGHSFSRAAHADAVEMAARFLSESLRSTRQLAESVRR